MEDIQIILSILWIALMLIYFLGDVMRIFSGNFKPGEIGDMKIGQWGWVGISAMMLLPILMVVLNLFLGPGVGRWTNIVLSAIFLIMNLFSLHTYPGYFDRFLLAVSLVVNVLIIRYAWIWI